jgi:phage terminase small subunit
MPLSSDPKRRSRQLANLQPGGGAAGPGNGRAVTHGAYAALAPDRLDVKAREVFDALGADAPVRDGDGSLPAADVAAVRLLADVLCRLDDIGGYLSRRGWEGEDGKPRPVLDYEARLRGHALDLMRELGMTPASRAKLGLDLVRAKRTLDQEVADARGAWGDAIDGTENYADPSRSGAREAASYQTPKTNVSADEEGS